MASGLYSFVQYGLNQGEIGSYLQSRQDLEVYRRAAASMVNMICTPQGPAMRRPGFEKVEELFGPVALQPGDGKKFLLKKFDFNREQQYTLAFSDKLITILKDKETQITVASPWPLSAVRGLRVTQRNDLLVITHDDYPPYELRRTGSHIDWELAQASYDNYPYFRYAPSGITIQASATAIGTGVTYGVSGTVPYWTAEYTQNVGIKVGTTAKKATIKGLFQDATGGTALSSAGTAANAFDNTVGTLCNGGSNGWIGYNFGGVATKVKNVGIKANASGTWNLVFESDDNDAFTSPTVRGTATITAVAGSWVYANVTYAGSPESRFRVRITGGTALDVQDMIFNKGFKATGDNIEVLPSTTPEKVWTEQGWGPHVGYPRCAIFFSQRLVFLGIRAEPMLTFFSYLNDFNNFDDTAATAAYAFAQLLDVQGSPKIVDVAPSRNGLAVFTTDAEILLTFTDDLVKPANALVNVQTRYGSKDVSVVEVDGKLMFPTADGKQLRTFEYSFDVDAYQAENKTTLAHNTFNRNFFENTTPRAMASLRSYKNTQANLLFVPREDGQIACLSIDATAEVLAWSRFITNGWFYDAAVVETTHYPEVGPVPTLWVITERLIDGQTRVFMECLTEENVFLDHWYAGYQDPADTEWGGATTLPNTTVQVIGDGLVQGYVEVDEFGDFSLDNAVNSVTLGLPYQSQLIFHPIPIDDRNGAVKGKSVSLKRITVSVNNCLDLNVNGIDGDFRFFGTELLDAPLVSFSGQISMNIENVTGGIEDAPILIFTIDEPVQCIIDSYKVDMKVGN